ncbi:putative internalin [Fimbriiglobus ruber]|uniref:Putative internalin n=1 Tax=Fimbriiglobus ruber TaxID=1908690 RepID=A0A225DJW6_9BACT|nr:putative internalin [Fimbriiglobus ruber]
MSYPAAGDYTVGVTVTDGTGQSTSAAATIHVDPLLTVSVAPTPPTGWPNQTITFAATPSGGDGTYTYSWPDGTSGASDGTSFTRTGYQSVTVQVTDGHGQTASGTGTVYINTPHVSISGGQDAIAAGPGSTQNGYFDIHRDSTGWVPADGGVRVAVRDSRPGDRLRGPVGQRRVGVVRIVRHRRVGVRGPGRPVDQAGGREHDGVVGVNR